MRKANIDKLSTSVFKTILEQQSGSEILMNAVDTTKPYYRFYNILSYIRDAFGTSLGSGHAFYPVTASYNGQNATHYLNNGSGVYTKEKGISTKTGITSSTALRSTVKSLTSKYRTSKLIFTLGSITLPFEGNYRFVRKNGFTVKTRDISDQGSGGFGTYTFGNLYYKTAGTDWEPIASRMISISDFTDSDDIYTDSLRITANTQLTIGIGDNQFWGRLYQGNEYGVRFWDVSNFKLARYTTIETRNIDRAGSCVVMLTQDGRYYQIYVPGGDSDYTFNQLTSSQGAEFGNLTNYPNGDCIEFLGSAVFIYDDRIWLAPNERFPLEVIQECSVDIWYGRPDLSQHAGLFTYYASSIPHYQEILNLRSSAWTNAALSIAKTDGTQIVSCSESSNPLPVNYQAFKFRGFNPASGAAGRITAGSNGKTILIQVANTTTSGDEFIETQIPHTSVFNIVWNSSIMTIDWTENGADRTLSLVPNSTLIGYNTAISFLPVAQSKGNYVFDVFPMLDDSGNTQSVDIGSLANPFDDIYAKRVHADNVATKVDVSSASVEDRKWENITGKPSSYNPPAGTVIWYSGKSLPSGYLVCNGQSLNKTTYANLFNAIGYTYGGSGNNFNVPNLSDGNGRFIRATTDFSKVGTKQDDAIRNITGRTSAGSDSTNYDGTAGAFYQGSDKEYKIGSLSSWGSRYTYRFDANRDKGNMGNPMAGHANGADIHPYNISLVPLIAY